MRNQVIIRCRIIDNGKRFAVLLIGACALHRSLRRSAPLSRGDLFAKILRIGAMLYGCGCVLLAFIQADFME
jgi:hypothetical protein